MHNLLNSKICNLQTNMHIKKMQNMQIKNMKCVTIVSLSIDYLTRGLIYLIRKKKYFIVT